MADTFARSDKRMVTGLFPDRTSAETAYQAVTERGYSRDDVNLVMSDDARARHFGDAAGIETELGTKAASGAGIGGAIGGSLGAIAAAIAAVGTSLVVPGLGLVVAGPLAAAIVGAGAGGATGGILGALIGYGIPEERVKHYEEGIRNGGILMGVTPRSDEDALHFHNKWTESRGEHVLGGADSGVTDAGTGIGTSASMGTGLGTDIGTGTAATDLRSGTGADMNTGMAMGGGAGAGASRDAGSLGTGNIGSTGSSTGSLGSAAGIASTSASASPSTNIGDDALDTRVGKFESHESTDRSERGGMLNDIGSGMGAGGSAGSAGTGGMGGMSNPGMYGKTGSSGGGMSMNMQSDAGNMSMQSGANASSSMSGAGNQGKLNTTPGAMADATLAGGAAAAFDPSAEDTYWRNSHQREPYYSGNYTYDDYAPAYRLGYTSRQHSDQSFDYSEPMLRSQWESVKGSSRLTWEQAKDATKAAWNRMT